MPRSTRLRLRLITLAVSQFAFQTEQKNLLRLLSVLLPLLSALTPAHALDPRRSISQYGHTTWRMDGLRDGLSPIAQTVDGFMWFGTQLGLLRFDGVRFVPQTDLNAKLPSSTVISLAAAKDGSLWIGTERGLSRLVNDNLVNYPDVTGWVSAILETRDGKVWFMTIDVTNDHAAAFCLVIDHGTRCYGKADGVLMHDAITLAEDAEGYLWSSNHNAAVQWKPGSFKAYELKASKSKRLIGGVTAIMPTSAGPFWVGMEESGPGLGLQQFDRDKNRWRPFMASHFDSSTLPVRTLLTDRDGSLWAGTEGMGLYRIAGTTVDRFQRVDGLSNDAVHGLYQDREGNLWATSLQGIDCFHELAVTTFSSSEGSGLNEADGIHSSRDGTLWVSRPGSLGGIRYDKSFSLRTGKDLPGKQITSVFEGHDGRLWVGIDRGLSMYHNGAFHEIKKAGSNSLGLVVGIAEDIKNNIWVEVIGQPRTLFRIRDLQVKEEFPAPRMPAARKVAADPQGGIWLGLLDGNLARYREGHLELFPYPHSKLDVAVEQLTVSADGAVYGATKNGLVAWRHGKQQILTVHNGLPCDNVFSHIFDSRSSLWLYTECGLIEITSGELQRWWQNPKAKLRTRTLDTFDGVHPGKSYFNGAARTPDGRLWFVNSVAVQMIDPAHMATHGLAPPVKIEQVIADRKSYSSLNYLRLPPLTRDLQINYTGLSFVVPEKVQFRYKLENHDVDWQEPGSRRQAFYSDLSPGSYRFRVIACNNSGLWNHEGAALDFTIAAAWYQTNWFRVSSVASFCLLLWVLYQLKLRQLAEQFNTMMEARVGERTRIARELHDTLLQSLHGLMFRFQAARNMLPRRPEEALEALDGAITRTEQAIAQSRDAIQDLRVPSAQTDLADSIAAMNQEFASSHRADDRSPVFSLTVEGQRRQLSSAVQNEATQIAHEILANSFHHADAHRIEAEIRYSRHFLWLRFRDDGKGIDPKILQEGGRPGHWGLPGIRERAERIGAKLDGWSEAGAGTEFQLSVSAAIAYKKDRNNPPIGFFHKRGKL